MNLPKAKQTRRKFYGKWLYKVTIDLGSASIFRSHSLDDIIAFCDCSSEHYTYYSDKGRAVPFKTIIRKVAAFLIDQPGDIWGKRIESDQIDLYTNSKTFYNDAIEKFQDTIIHRFEPAEGSEESLESTQTIIVKKLPHNRYNYRVYLLPHKMSFDTEGKEKFISWLEQQERITCTPSIKDWFIKTNWNWDRRYVLVEDEQSLLMMKLRNSEVVGKVYKFIVSDK